MFILRSDLKLLVKAYAPDLDTEIGGSLDSDVQNKELVNIILQNLLTASQIKEVLDEMVTKIIMDFGDLESW